VGRAHVQLAALTAEVEGEARALTVLAQAVGYHERQLALTPGDPEARLDHGEALFQLAIRRARNADPAAGRKGLDDVRAIHEQLLADPAVRADAKLALRAREQLGRTLSQIARWLAPADKNQARVSELLGAAIDHLQAVYEADPGRADGVYNLGLVLVEAGQLARVFGDLGQARRNLATARRVLSETPPAVAARPRRSTCWKRPSKFGSSWRKRIRP